MLNKIKCFFDCVELGIKVFLMILLLPISLLVGFDSYLSSLKSVIKLDSVNN